MKKLFFVAAIVLTALQMLAVNVDLAHATATAKRFINVKANAKVLQSTSTNNLQLIHAEVNSSNATQAAYYIFNYDRGFIIVSGDDRAHRILAHGDRPLDMKRMPENMKFWLSTYKKQIEYLQAHPGMVVDSPSLNRSLRTPDVAPLLTAEWGQSIPYCNHCPIYDGLYCLTGCPATSLAMVFYYWKYPFDPTPEVEGYFCSGCELNIPALPSIIFDWDNMLDRYTDDYTPAQADAVAWLMRYIGQEEHMIYTPDASGTMTDDILRAVTFFGYDEEMARLESKTLTDDNYNDTAICYTDEEWAVMLQNELAEGRPVVYCAYERTAGCGYIRWSGHAFNVDGYSATDDTYHVNWGWSGEGNGNFALNAFSYGGYTFNFKQQMIMGIQPPATGPTIRVNLLRMDMSAIVGKTATATFSVKGMDLSNPVTLVVNDESGAFSIDAASVATSDLENGKVITVTYAPQASGIHTASITLSCPDAEDKTITVNGTAALETYMPHLLPADSTFINLTQFRADWTDETPRENVESYTLEVSTRHAVELLDIIDGSIYPGDYESITLSYPWSGNGVNVGYSSIYFDNDDNDGYIAFTAPGGYPDDVFSMQITTLDRWFGDGNLTVGSQQTAPVSHKFNFGETYTWLVTASEGEMIKITSTDEEYSPDMSMIKVYYGNVNELNSVGADDDDANYRLITGINDMFYTVKDLTEAGTYYYRVKALYTDGTQSDWSKSQRVTLLGHAFKPGDVNADGEVGIADVNAVIDIILTGIDVSGLGDVNRDGEINIADINAVIDIILAS